MKKYIINKNDSEKRVDSFVLKVTKGLPKSLLYKFLRLKKIKLNRKRCQGNEVLKEGDVLELYINDEFFEETKVEPILKAPTDFKPIYEDENIVLLFKKAGLLCHSGNEKGLPSLVDMLKGYLFSKGEYNPAEESSFSPALCNRLDRNTSGIVIGAKNAMALREVNRKISEGKLKKLYLCLVYGKIEKEQGEINLFIKKTENEQTVKVSKTEKKGYKKAITLYKVVNYNKEKDVSLLEINLITGRTHQIRASLDFIGHTLVGEKKYIKSFPKSPKLKNPPKFQALCAYKIGFLKDDLESDLSYLDGKDFEVPEDIHNLHLSSK